MDKAKKTEFPVYLVGQTFTVPAAGASPVMNIPDKFGRKARVRSIFVPAGLDDMYLSIAKTGGGEPVLDHVSMASLRQDKPVPVVFPGGDYKVTFDNQTGAEKKTNFTLFVEYPE